jgi:hypothetical protein
VIDGEDYSRFFMPPVRGMDEGSRDEEREYETPRMRELAPFLYRGESPWPFKYQIKGEQ